MRKSVYFWFYLPIFSCIICMFETTYYNFQTLLIFAIKTFISFALFYIKFRLFHNYIFKYFWYIYGLCYYSCPFSAPSLNSILPSPSLPHSPPIVYVHGSYLSLCVHWEASWAGSLPNWLVFGSLEQPPPTTPPFFSREGRLFWAALEIPPAPLQSSQMPLLQWSLTLCMLFTNFKFLWIFCPLTTR